MDTKVEKFKWHYRECDRIVKKYSEYLLIIKIRLQLSITV